MYGIDAGLSGERHENRRQQEDQHGAFDEEPRHQQEDENGEHQ